MEAHLRQHHVPVLQGGVCAFCANGSVSHVHGFLTQQLFKTPRSIALLSNASLRDQGCCASLAMPLKAYLRQISLLCLHA